jgi:hypothetical protein
MMLSDLQTKLLILALSVSASDGEKVNAINALTRSLSNEKKDAYDLVKAISQEPVVVTKYTTPPPEDDPFGERMLFFGKYAGEKVKSVDPDYLVWMSTLKNKRNEIFLSELKQYVGRRGW